MNSFRRLTADGTRKLTPRYIKGGREVVYTTFAGPKLLRLTRLTVADGAVAAFHPEAAKSETEPAFSRDGRVMAFMQLRGALSLAVVIRDLERKEPAEVPPPGGFAGACNPGVAPDGSRVLFAIAENTHQKVFSVNAKGGDRKQLTDGVGADNWPSYSPDGGRIVFGSSRLGVYDLFVMNADGGGVRRLTHGPHRSVRPEFSPDGRRIAFARFVGGAMRVWVMDADGRGARPVVTDSEGDDYPGWHPDGRRLVVASQRAGQHDLYEVGVG
ncbi:MAG: hypothetical protein K2X82_17345 [Gemmataceae bacterium]|nr:hypothetical protein [Gemmataceae bacterium]